MIFGALELKKNLTLAQTSPLAVKIVIRIVVLALSAQMIWVCNIYIHMHILHVTSLIMHSDSRKCIDEAGTPPANQAKIINMER